MTDRSVNKRQRHAPPIKVLEITQASGGGVQRYVIQLCRYLDKSLFSVTGCCSTESLVSTETGDVPFPEVFERFGVPYFMVPMKRAISPIKDFLALLAVYRRIKRDGFDIVHAHSSKAGVLARVAARVARVPVVLYSPHAFSFAVPEKSIGASAYTFFERIAANFCDGIIADSPGERDLALSYRICRADKIRVVSPGVEIPKKVIGDERQRRTRVLSGLGIAYENKIVTFIGRLALQKDPITFIRSAQLMGSAHGGISFLLAGDGPLREQCARAIGDNDLNGRIKLLGWRRDYKELIAVSDVMVLCSLYEGLPFILLESMAQGKPVVASSVTGIRDVITHGQDGFLVKPQTPHRLSEMCMQILMDPEEAARIGGAAQAKVLEHFSVKKCLSLTEETYIHLLEKRQTGNG